MLKLSRFVKSCSRTLTSPLPVLGFLVQLDSFMINDSFQLAVACVNNVLAQVAGFFLKGETRCEPAARAQRGTGRMEAARHRCRVPSGRRPASVPSQVHRGATVLPETWTVWWYRDHTVLQLELWMMDDESSAWEVILPACFNSVWLQALNIAQAFTSVCEGMWWLPRSLFFLLLHE